MSDDFSPLDHVVDGLIDAVSPSGRGKLSREIARDLRGANARRIKANVTPEGAPMAPRRAVLEKARPVPLRSGAKTAVTKVARRDRMFQRATSTSVLRAQSTAEEASVGYPGAVARVMSVHHFGLRDHVTRDPGSPEVTYAARPLIGLPDEDRERIFDKVTAAIEGAALS